MRRFFPVTVAAALAFTATAAWAEDLSASRPGGGRAPQLWTGDRLCPDGQPAGAAEPDLGTTSGSPEAAACPAPQRLTEGEIDALQKLAAESPDLAEQSGGYLTNEDLLTILLIVLIIVVIL